MHYQEPGERLYRMYYWINYVHVSCQLMMYRLEYLRKNEMDVLSKETEDLFIKLNSLVKQEFLSTFKLRMKGYDDQKVIQKMERYHEISKMYFDFMISLRTDVFLVMTKHATKSQKNDIYLTTKEYRRYKIS